MHRSRVGKGNAISTCEPLLTVEWLGMSPPAVRHQHWLTFASFRAFLAHWLPQGHIKVTLVLSL